MDESVKNLYSELRKTKMELLVSLKNKNTSLLIRPLIEEELKDIENTLEKIEKGQFGICEISGEIMPTELLQMIPTLKTLSDCNKVEDFYRKALFH